MTAGRCLPFLLSALLSLAVGCGQVPATASRAGRPPTIQPDYSRLEVPPNIAPLNFRIAETGDAFCVRLRGRAGEPVVLRTGQVVQIPPGPWRRLLEQNRGGEYLIEIWARGEDGAWTQYEPLANQVSADSIDSHLTYRLIGAGYVLWEELGIYQRHLEDFDEEPVLENRALQNACINCHAFAGNDPATFLVHLRQNLPGTLVLAGGRAERVNTKTAWTMTAGVYPAWHPDKRHVAFSVNLIAQTFSDDDRCPIEVGDRASDLVVYDTATRTVTTSPQVSTRNRENLPCWSPDGKWLYYISAPPAPDRQSVVNSAYSLVRIPCEVDANRWGEPDTLLAAGSVGGSYSFPRIRPDGRLLIFCVSDHGYFTIHNASSDLWAMDLETRRTWQPPINSAAVESYHSWSSNGRWLAFSSKRLDNRYARTFFTHVDAQGEFSKPFVLPQRDPDRYATYLLNYNVPELTRGEVPFTSRQLRDLAYTEPVKVTFDGSVDVDALSGATYVRSHPPK